MPEQRFGLHFVDEQAAEDRARWTEWIAGLPDSLRHAIQLGERRPLITLAAPFAADGPETRPSDELAGLGLARTFIDELAKLATATERSITMLRAGRKIGRIEASGADADLANVLVEWQALLDSRQPDEGVWERVGWVSLWAGVLPREELTKLLHEHIGTEGPISSFARAIRINFYDHDLVERVSVTEPQELYAVAKRLTRGATFVDQLPEDVRQRPTTAVIAMYDADFSQRPRNAARNRMVFIGSFQYRGR